MASASFSTLSKKQSNAAPAPPAPAPPAAPSGDPDAAANDAITQNYQRLHDVLSGIPDINFEEKFRPMIEAAKAEKIPQMPGGLQMFAASLGSPKNAPDILHGRFQEMHRAQSEKDAHLMRLQEAIINGDIAQLAEKGNFKKALAQSESLARLKSTLDRIERSHALEDYKTKTEYLFGQRAGLEGVKHGNAMELMQNKIKLIADNYHLDEKMALELQRESGALQQRVLTAIVNPNAFGERILDDPQKMQDAMLEYQQGLETIANGLVAKAKGPHTKLSPTPENPPAATGGFAKWKASQGSQR